MLFKTDYDCGAGDIRSIIISIKRWLFTSYGEYRLLI